MLEKVAIFILFLFPLIFFHELGHYLFAKLFGVKVEVFSLGFGPKLFKFNKFGTEFTLSLIPLGGYVKMFGDDPMGERKFTEEEKKQAFVEKGKWARFWIIFGGPLANLILAYFIFFGVLLTGEKVPEPRLGVIPENTIFYDLGFRTGDLLTKVNGNELLSITDLSVDSNSDPVKTVTIKRGVNGETFDLTLNKPLRNFIEELIKYPPHFRKPIIVDGGAKKYVLTLTPKKVDWHQSIEGLASLNGISSLYMYELNAGSLGSLQQETNQEVLLEKLVQYDKEKIISITDNSDPKNNFYYQLQKLGYYPHDLLVSSIVMKSPAEAAGIKSDDIIVAINDVTIFSFEGVKSKVQSIKEGDKIKVTYLRESKSQDIVVTPVFSKIGEDRVPTIGIYSGIILNFPKQIEGKSKGLIESLGMAFSRTYETVISVLAGFKKLVTNQVSFKSVGGPLAIGKVASDSFSISLSYFFKWMALFSVNLGVINLFPIPVLDGGHILFIILETLNRGPLSRRKMELAQQFGLSILFVLISAGFLDI